MSDSVGQYLNEIGLVPLLTAAEERELSQIIEKGVEARERLAELADAFGVRATAARAFDIMAPKEKNGGATDAQGPKAFPSQRSLFNWTIGSTPSIQLPSSVA